MNLYISEKILCKISLDYSRVEIAVAARPHDN